KEAKFDAVSVCESVMGLSKEAAKASSDNKVIACTTSAYFESWNEIPHPSDVGVKLIVGSAQNDFETVVKACTLVDVTVITNVILTDCEIGTLKRSLPDMSKPSRNFIGRAFDSTLSLFYSTESGDDPQQLIESSMKYGDINKLLLAKRLLLTELARLTAYAKIIHSTRKSVRAVESSDSSFDVTSQGFVESCRVKMHKTIDTIRHAEALIGTATKNGIYGFLPDKEQVRKLASRHNVDGAVLMSLVRKMWTNRRLVSWDALRKELGDKLELNHDSDKHWYTTFSHPHVKDEYLIALSPECVSDATAFLQDLKLFSPPVDFNERYIQCSDRHLADCSFYIPQSGLDEQKLLQLEGASKEYFAFPLLPEEREIKWQSVSLTELEYNLDKVMDESSAKGTPLHLFPRRSYDRLARDLVESGIIICSDYHNVRRSTHSYDRAILPIVNDSVRDRYSLVSSLEVESALMEFGSCDWTEWMGQKLRYHGYTKEVVGFYHRTIAVREFCAQDERLIERLQESMTCSSLNEARSSEEKIKVDAFINSTMETLNRGLRLVKIDPPFKSEEAEEKLAAFIRSRRIPPPKVTAASMKLT
ncbi:hypothetical protein PFISCL1PPCAC_23611, partial [Pristionchus fissidentatus]